MSRFRFAGDEERSASRTESTLPGSETLPAAASAETRLGYALSLSALGSSTFCLRCSPNLNGKLLGSVWHREQF